MEMNKQHGMNVRSGNKPWEGIKGLFDEPVRMINMDQVAGFSSKYGSTYAIITEKQIEELRNGKLIHIFDGEYSHFICLKKEDV